MKGFFKEHEVRRYTHSEKIQYIFQQLIAYLHPVCINRRTEGYCVSDSLKIKKRIQIIDCIILNQKYNNIPEVPFDNINCTMTSDEKIKIYGDTFNYEFPPEHILTLYERIKKLKDK